MKAMYVMGAAVALSFGSCAQDIPQNEVPSIVINAFQAKYPNATDAEWEKAGENFLIEFDLGHIDHELWIDPKGAIIKHEEEIASGDLPQAIRTAIAKEFAAYRIDDAEKIEKGGKTYYRVELDGSMGDRTVVYDSAAHQVTDLSVLY